MERATAGRKAGRDGRLTGAVPVQVAPAHKKCPACEVVYRADRKHECHRLAFARDLAKRRKAADAKPVVKYRGYKIQGTQEYLDHYVVIDRDGCNCLPGGVCPESVTSAKRCIDMLELVGADKFWELDNLFDKYDAKALADDTVRDWTLFKLTKNYGGSYENYKRVTGTYREVLEKYSADKIEVAI